MADVLVDTNVLKLSIKTDAELQRRVASEREKLRLERRAILDLIALARRGEIFLFQNLESKIEEMFINNISSSRRRWELWQGVEIKSVEPPFKYSRIVAGLGLRKKQLTEIRDKVLSACQDKRFKEIAQAIGGNKNDDAYHILSAERAGIEYLVTVDTRLINSVRHSSIPLSVKVGYPSELVAELAVVSSRGEGPWR